MWFIMNNINLHSIKWGFYVYKHKAAETVQYKLEIISAIFFYTCIQNGSHSQVLYFTNYSKDTNKSNIKNKILSCLVPCMPYPICHIISAQSRGCLACYITLDKPGF